MGGRKTIYSNYVHRSINHDLRLWVLRDPCPQLHKCTLSKIPSLKVGGEGRGDREGADCPGCVSPPSPAILRLPLNSQACTPWSFPISGAVPSFWTLKPKTTERSLTPLFLSHPHPVPRQILLALPSKYIQGSTTSSHLHQQPLSPA